MKITRHAGLPLAACALFSTPVAALDSESVSDIRCLVVGMKLAGKPDGPSQAAGTLLASYYIGRLDGRVPGIDVQQFMTQEIARMTPSDYEKEGKRCGTSIGQRARQVEQINKTLVERAKQADKTG